MNKNDNTKRERLSTRTKKELFLEALKKTMGVLTPALKMANIKSRNTVRKWEKDDPEFATRMEETRELADDFVETSFFKQIQEGNTACIIFYVKTRLKHRGYVERTEITGADGGSIKVQLKTDEELDNELAELERKAKA